MKVTLSGERYLKACELLENSIATIQNYLQEDSSLENLERNLALGDTLHDLCEVGSILDEHVGD